MLLLPVAMETTRSPHPRVSLTTARPWKQCQEVKSIRPDEKYNEIFY